MAEYGRVSIGLWIFFQGLGYFPIDSLFRVFCRGCFVADIGFDHMCFNLCELCEEIVQLFLKTCM